MDTELLGTALEIMAKGMTGIFIALSILYGCVIGLIKIFPVKTSKESESSTK